MRFTVEAMNGGLFNKFRSIVTRFAPVLALAGAIAAQPASAEGFPSPDTFTERAPAAAAPAQDFKSLFQSWKRLDGAPRATISVPSLKPVNNVTFTSSFGVRSDPFRGSAAMHAGIDLAGPLGTRVYATADGVVTHAGRQGGYGNMVQINHGRGIETRYGHLSQILVPENTRVKRGQLIGLMGSTGRSTGSHLHYEVRVDGKAVNPIPFLQSGEYLVQVQDRATGAVGGPGK